MDLFWTNREHEVLSKQGMQGQGAHRDQVSRNLAGVDADLAKTCTLLNNKIQALERKQVSLSSAAQLSL